jgi:hypothetical protein
MKYEYILNAGIVPVFAAHDPNTEQGTIYNFSKSIEK